MSIALLLLATAWADCRPPEAFFGLPPGDAPLEATVYFFTPPGMDAEPAFSVRDAGGEAVPFTTQEIESTFGIWQIQISAPSAGTVHLSTRVPALLYGQRPEVSAELQVVEDWKLTYTGCGLGRVSTMSVDGRDGRSHNARVDLLGPVPPAWIVEWAPTKRWAAGERNTLWLPGNHHGFFGSQDSYSDLLLGESKCLGELYAWSHPSIVAQLYAMDVDGERRIVGPSIILFEPK